jgi:branched-chain amino acid transport system ATP-binding protein
MTLQAADFAYVTEVGRITKSGTGKDLLSYPAVKEAYLGS